MNMNKCKILNFFKIAILLGAFSYAQANEKDASHFVSDTANRVIEIVKRTDFNEQLKEDKLNDIFLQVVDTKWIGRFSLGQYWRTINSKEQKEFLDLYTKYLSGMYVPNFKKYTGNVVKVVGSKKLRPNEYLVQTVIVNPTDQRGDIHVNYLLKQDPQLLEKFIIFDIVAEGVSLITTQRAELGSVMANNGFNATIELLKKRTSK